MISEQLSPSLLSQNQGFFTPPRTPSRFERTKYEIIVLDPDHSISYEQTAIISQSPRNYAKEKQEQKEKSRQGCLDQKFFPGDDLTEDKPRLSSFKGSPSSRKWSESGRMLVLQKKKLKNQVVEEGPLPLIKKKQESHSKPNQEKLFITQTPKAARCTPMRVRKVSDNNGFQFKDSEQSLEFQFTGVASRKIQTPSLFKPRAQRFQKIPEQEGEQAPSFDHSHNDKSSVSQFNESKSITPKRSEGNRSQLGDTPGRSSVLKKTHVKSDVPKFFLRQNNQTKDLESNLRLFKEASWRLAYENPFEKRSGSTKPLQSQQLTHLHRAAIPQLWRDPQVIQKQQEQDAKTWKLIAEVQSKIEKIKQKEKIEMAQKFDPKQYNQHYCNNGGSQKPLRSKIQVPA